MIFVWTLRDVLALVSLGLIMLWAFYWVVRDTITEARCPHDGGVNETSACDAICRKCGKNLGFIGSWRERQPK